MARGPDSGKGAGSSLDIYHIYTPRPGRGCCCGCGGEGGLGPATQFLALLGVPGLIVRKQLAGSVWDHV